MTAATAQPPFCFKIKIKTKGIDALKPHMSSSTVNGSKIWPWLIHVKTQKKEIHFEIHFLTIKDTNKTGKTLCKAFCIRRNNRQNIILNSS